MFNMPAHAASSVYCRRCLKHALSQLTTQREVNRNKLIAYLVQLVISATIQVLLNTKAMLVPKVIIVLTERYLVLSNVLVEHIIQRFQLKLLMIAFHAPLEVSVPLEQYTLKSVRMELSVQPTLQHQKSVLQEITVPLRSEINSLAPHLSSARLHQLIFIRSVRMELSVHQAQANKTCAQVVLLDQAAA